MIPEIVIDLHKKPKDRWYLPDELSQQADTLLQSYIDDLGGIGTYGRLLKAYSLGFVHTTYRQEMASLAEQINRPTEDVLLGNLYYDVLKVIFGCTAFAVDTPNGPLHARNLDWWTENDMLSRFTTLVHYQQTNPDMNFTTVGWPGYVGAMSGVAPGRFAITLNAVLSKDRPTVGKPISLFMRTVFEKAQTFEDAVQMLTRQRLTSDCLLLVTGTQSGEMVVIERTPTRAVVRQPENSFIVVANDYKALDVDEDPGIGELQATSDRRFDTALTCIQLQKPQTVDACFEILTDTDVQMGITVQQMVFSARTGLVDVRLPITQSQKQEYSVPQ